MTKTKSAPPRVRRRIHLGDKRAPLRDFYKLSGRAAWTDERIAMLKTLWYRGNTVEAIAAELGINAAAVATARARFRLVPRRALPGRPKTKTVPKIERVAFETSRLMEFCTERELVNQTGHGVYVWPLVIVKEGIDNALDACEEAEIAPVITLDITQRQGQDAKIVLTDNGPGIPESTINGVLNYAVRVSSREAYVSPTRGAQGNALKTLLPMTYVLTQGRIGTTTIEARGITHDITFAVNKIENEPMIARRKSDSPITSGTRLTVTWPRER